MVNHAGSVAGVDCVGKFWVTSIFHLTGRLYIIIHPSSLGVDCKFVYTLVGGLAFLFEGQFL